MEALFRRFPSLRERLPRVVLADLPTPVTALDLPSRLGGGIPLFVKRDDLSAAPYGGNKVRKLELLLAAARRDGAAEVMTFGVAGSNHALATALYAERAGLRSISILTPQRNAGYVRRNLLAHLSCNGELHHYADERAAATGAAWQRLRHRRATGLTPLRIPGGGSSALGTVGFVNAAFELREQIEAGVLPEPERLYVALGTMGTAAGLALGLQAAGLRTRLVPVRVVRESIGNVEGMAALFRRTSALLHRLDPGFPLLDMDPRHARIRHEQFGEKYAAFTEAGMQAVRLMDEVAGLALEGTYTGKAMAALLADLQAADRRPASALFWLTYNGRDMSPLIAGRDYRRLPAAFHAYFERPLQPLDIVA